MKRDRNVPRRPKKYSHEFPTTGESADFRINRVPIQFWRRVQDRARREGVSLRSLVLRALREWVDAPLAPPPLKLPTQGADVTIERIAVGVADDLLRDPKFRAGLEQLTRARLAKPKPKPKRGAPK